MVVRVRSGMATTPVGVTCDTFFFHPHFKRNFMHDLIAKENPLLLTVPVHQLINSSFINYNVSVLKSHSLKHPAGGTMAERNQASSRYSAPPQVNAHRNWTLVCFRSFLFQFCFHFNSTELISVQ